jgi:dolichol kinase
VTPKLSLNREVQRKFIHISVSIIPLAYYFGTSKDIILAVSAVLAAGFLTADILRLNFSLARRYFLKVFSSLLRDGEKEKKLTGASYLFLGTFAAVYLFPIEAAVPAVLFAALADPMAAIIGKRFGKKEFFGKTIEGALGFFLTASAVVLIFTDYNWTGLGIALFCAVLEFLAVQVDDNLLIPFAAGYLLMVLK